jgi:hypothetical protein
MTIIGLRILVAGVVITTVVTVSNSNAATVGMKLTNAVSTVQTALINAGFPATVARVLYAATVANPSATPTISPTLVPSTSIASTDSNTKGKEVVKIFVMIISHL